MKFVEGRGNLIIEYTPEGASGMTLYADSRDLRVARGAGKRVLNTIYAVSAQRFSQNGPGHAQDILYCPVLLVNALHYTEVSDVK